MDAPAYDKLLETLDSAKLILASHVGNLSSADLRIRCLLNITTDEARRALRETRVASRARTTNDAYLGQASPTHPAQSASSL